jgi:hypothetical protein
MDNHPPTPPTKIRPSERTRKARTDWESSYSCSMSRSLNKVMKFKADFVELLVSNQVCKFLVPLQGPKHVQSHHEIQKRFYD